MFGLVYGLSWSWSWSKIYIPFIESSSVFRYDWFSL